MAGSARPALVVGPTGNAGAPTVEALLARGVPVRAGVRDPGAAAGLPDGVQPVALDLTDPATFPAAVDGIGSLFLLRPPAISDVGPTLNALLDAAAAAGRPHVVFLSVAGADRNRVVPHHEVERHLAAGSLAHTILRPGFFAQNLGDAYRRDIAEDDRLYVPAGTGRPAWVDVRDVGELAAAILSAPAGHEGQGYLLTGPAPLAFASAAALLTRALGRTVRYRHASVPGYARHLHARGLPAAQIAVQTVLHLQLRAGGGRRVDPTLGRLLGRAPRTLADYVGDHAGLWARSSPA